MSGPGEITRLLAEWSGGNQAALDRLVPIVYGELRSLASHYMRSERSEPLLQTTALVHEAYLRLLERKQVNCDNRSQFFAVAAQAMRRILVDYARGRNRAKRGGGAISVVLDDIPVISDKRADELIAINSALDGLSSFDERKGKIFELRYFGGMTVDEVADVMKISPITVARDWRMAKLWLRREMWSQVQHAG